VLFIGAVAGCDDSTNGAGYLAVDAELLRLDTFFAGAQFYEAPEEIETCTTEMLDGCEIRTCTYCNGCGESHKVTVGDLRLVADNEVVMLYGVTEIHAGYGYQGHGGKWHAGGQLAAHASGDVAPAFDAALTVPATATITQPVIQQNPETSAYEVHIGRGMDLALAWQGIDTGDILVEITAYPGDEKEVTVKCPLPAASGAGIVTARVLDSVSQAALFTTIDIHPFAGMKLSVDGWEIDFSVQNNGLWTDGTPSNADLVFE
jgi:hypothetical protein